MLSISDYSHESCLPCELKEIVSHVRKRSIHAGLSDKVGLKESVLVVPFNRGFFLCSKDIALVTDTLDVITQLDGTKKLGGLVADPPGRSMLEQLNYYGLLSFGTSSGTLRVAEAGLPFAAEYEDKNFVTFSLVPLTVELNITNTCNFTCVHCLKSSEPRSGQANDEQELSTPELLRIINECGRLGVVNLQFMGGEPLAHPHFFELVKAVEELIWSKIE